MHKQKTPNHQTQSCLFPFPHCPYITKRCPTYRYQEMIWLHHHHHRHVTVMQSATCWPVPVSLIQKSLQRSSLAPSAFWCAVFHYPVQTVTRLAIYIFFPMTRQPLGGLGRLIFKASRSHYLDTPQSVGLLWTSDQPVAETSNWQHTTLTTDRYPCHRWDSNPQSQ
jgi:hypothetical protein